MIRTIGCRLLMTRYCALCCLIGSGRGFSDGFIIGTFFSSADPTPGGADNGKRVLTVPGDMTLNV